jgi:ketosteroid isomerase-like protein
MENATKNTQVIRDIYGAFGRGDIAGILSAFADDIVWQPVLGTGAHVPTAGTRHGKQAVAEFFKILGESLTFEQFEPKQFIAEGDTVVALGSYRAKTKGGGTFAADWAMVFTFAAGRIVAFREFTDSAAINAAFEKAAV